MPLADQITQDLTAAMKDQQAERTGVLRLIKNSLKNEQIKLGHELSEDEAAKVLVREAKQRRDSIAAYTQGGRADLAQHEQAELDVIEEYLPDQMDEAELAKLVDRVMTEVGATEQAQMGMIIGKVMAEAGGTADGAAVARLVKERLSGV
jgi:uncharacterized protein